MRSLAGSFSAQCGDLFCQLLRLLSAGGLHPPAGHLYREGCGRNDDLDRLWLATTSSLIGRRDVLVVASVSCILVCLPDEYSEEGGGVSKGIPINREDLLRGLIDLQYDRNDMEFKRGTFRARGDVVEIFPAYETTAFRVELFGDEVESIWHINPTSGELLTEESQIFIYPAKHYVTDENNLIRACTDIRAELDQRVKELRMQGKLLECSGSWARTKYDIGDVAGNGDVRGD